MADTYISDAKKERRRGDIKSYWSKAHGMTRKKAGKELSKAGYESFRAPSETPKSFKKGK